MIIGYSDTLAKQLGIRQKTLQEAMDRKSTRLGRGTFRTVYSLGKKYVIKFPNKPNYKIQNLLEIYTFNSSTDKPYHDVLAKIIAYHENGDWVIMERASSVGRTPLYNFSNLWMQYLCDLHKGNVGMINGEKKVIDYGQLPDNTGSHGGRIYWNSWGCPPPLPAGFKTMFPAYKGA